MQEFPASGHQVGQTGFWTTLRHEAGIKGFPSLTETFLWIALSETTSFYGKNGTRLYLPSVRNDRYDGHLYSRASLLVFLITIKLANYCSNRLLTSSPCITRLGMYSGVIKGAHGYNEGRALNWSNIHLDAFLPVNIGILAYLVHTSVYSHSSVYKHGVGFLNSKNSKTLPFVKDVAKIIN
ncbi:uncharacterized protein PV06_02055 [Exophiala oligosperma]|uniref:Uncharacterized protein n=1 Tax=Exophiala oligosperma TaxID=215243 RepID=A0A0D2B2G5_9EURO|nr:uncharacterized protein PV06_02055 [Exophiala oligosperma]KIW46381.1 hypothetical protein PV06_02055 [Exophiala oligosperma]